ncbi:NifU-like domain-containing protein [Pelagophyceae sp. CCMP2097]|nr:NifU-like domain-containing protein [Pelagophyceae sp. CCMP2097]
MAPFFALAALAVSVLRGAGAFSALALRRQRSNTALASEGGVASIESPFKPGNAGSGAGGDVELPLTEENVEIILDEMRPYLIADGGNVQIDSIDGPIVRLLLVGACGTCPSSTMTIKMGLERRLMEAIPEISEVVQALPDAPALEEDAVNGVLDTVRPFLSVAGGDISLIGLSGVGSAQPSVRLELSGTSAQLNSVKQEISQRIHRHFMLSGLQVTWD